MKIIGLTGGIASGKNLVAEIFAKNAAVIFDADLEVHNLLNSDKSTIREVKNFFPESFVDGKIERKILAREVFRDEKKSEKNLKILEKILHPKVRKNYQKFLREAKKSKAKFAVLNVPLLLESEAYSCDYVVAIIAKKSLQKERFLQRAKKQNPKNFLAEKKNLEKKFTQILQRQLSDSKRKKAADFVIKNDGSKADLAKQIKAVIKNLATPLR